MGGFTVIREGLLISHGAFALMGDFNFHVEKKNKKMLTMFNSYLA